MKSDKTLYIIAGANGSGKTTFALSYVELNKLHFINADEIAKEYDPQDIQKYKIKAGKEFFRQLSTNLSQDNSFMIESTLSGKYLINIIKKAKSSGFVVVLIYLFLENEIENVLRVRNRVLNGGHNVPDEDIKRRYSRSKKLFYNIYKDMVDRWMLFFNGDDSYELVANEEQIFVDDLYDKFLKGVK